MLSVFPSLEPAVSLPQLIRAAGDGGLIMAVSMGKIRAQIIILEAGLLSKIFAKEDSGYSNSNSLPA